MATCGGKSLGPFLKGMLRIAEESESLAPRAEKKNAAITTPSK
jgi:hypothetical protein